jgi:hypothetical protein
MVTDGVNKNSELANLFSQSGWVEVFGAKEARWFRMLDLCAPSDVDMVKTCATQLQEIRRLKAGRELIIAAIAIDLPAVKGLALVLNAYFAETDPDLRKEAWKEVVVAMKAVVREMGSLSKIAVVAETEKARGGPGVLTRLWRWLV